MKNTFKNAIISIYKNNLFYSILCNNIDNINDVGGFT